MSHFTSIKTQIVEKEYLKQALSDLGHAYQEGNVQIRGYQGIQTPVAIKIPTKNSGNEEIQEGDRLHLVLRRVV